MRDAFVARSSLGDARLLDTALARRVLAAGCARAAGATFFRFELFVSTDRCAATARTTTTPYRHSRGEASLGGRLRRESRGLPSGRQILGGVQRAGDDQWLTRSAGTGTSS